MNTNKLFYENPKTTMFDLTLKLNVEHNIGLNNLYIIRHKNGEERIVNYGMLMSRYYNEKSSTFKIDREEVEILEIIKNI